MRQDMPESDRLFGLEAILHLDIAQVLIDGLVELELALLLQLHEGSGGNRFEGRSGAVDCVRGRRSLGPDVGVAESGFPHDGIAPDQRNRYGWDAALLDCLLDEAAHHGLGFLKVEVPALRGGIASESREERRDEKEQCTGSHEKFLEM